MQGMVDGRAVRAILLNDVYWGIRAYGRIRKTWTAKGTRSKRSRLRETRVRKKTRTRRSFPRTSGTACSAVTRGSPLLEIAEELCPQELGILPSHSFLPGESLDNR